jgi:Protein of unknown function (DUF2934)
MAKQRNKASVAVAETQTTQTEQPAHEYREGIAKLAYHLWQARGCPEGSPEEDWFTAEREMQTSEQKKTAGSELSRPFLV